LVDFDGKPVSAFVDAGFFILRIKELCGWGI
jgi:hypothetical protein